MARKTGAAPHGSYRGVPVRIMSKDLVESARSAARAEFRSFGRQVEYWATVGRLALENPTIPAELIHDSLIGAQEIAAGRGTPFPPAEKK